MPDQSDVDVDELRAIAAAMEQELLETVPDPNHPTAAQARRIELWRRVVLLAERVEGGDPASASGARSFPPAVRAVPSVLVGSPACARTAVSGGDRGGC